MYQHKLEKEIRCPLDYGLSVFGGKWKSRILCVLGSTKEPMRYGKLRHTLGNITDAALSLALKELIKDQMVHRNQYEEIPPRVEYHLTERGKSALPILLAIAKWAKGIQRELPSESAPECMRCDYAGDQETAEI